MPRSEQDAAVERMERRREVIRAARARLEGLSERSRELLQEQIEYADQEARFILVFHHGSEAVLGRQFDEVLNERQEV
jgi:hypothetical protein